MRLELVDAGFAVERPVYREGVEGLGGLVVDVELDRFVPSDVIIDHLCCLLMGARVVCVGLLTQK